MPKFPRGGVNWRQLGASKGVNGASKGGSGGGTGRHGGVTGGVAFLRGGGNEMGEAAVGASELRRDPQDIRIYGSMDTVIWVPYHTIWAPSRLYTVTLLPFNSAIHKLPIWINCYALWAGDNDLSTAQLVTSENIFRAARTHYVEDSLVVFYKHHLLPDLPLSPLLPIYIQRAGKDIRFAADLPVVCARPKKRDLGAVEGPIEHAKTKGGKYVPQPTPLGVRRSTRFNKEYRS
ncbi:hypothetical protein B0H19DRAFT_1067473 [Mycena capillaripes]|nr:hypothetical protein B0H19DRAFT_1067473 [Mycena capillaripes]